MDKKINFSVLLSIYKNEKVAYFHRAMMSIWEEQTIKPDEIVLVEDGKLTDELYMEINYWKTIMMDNLKLVVLKDNRGLGEALNIGLNACSNELVGRMDTDDISLPDRFEKQLAVFKNKEIDICSGWVSEFNEREHQNTGYRKVPEYHKQIAILAKKRNPMNHPAVMYRKKAVEEAGGYLHMPWFEDYYLWIRMLEKGAIFYNLQVVLVHMRAGSRQLVRRRGFAYAKQEFNFMMKLKDIKFLNYTGLIYNVLTRFIFRIIPKFLLRLIYSKLRK